MTMATDTSAIASGKETVNGSGQRSEAQTSSGSHDGNKEQHHSAIISLVLTKTTRIEKETKGRRYKDLHLIVEKSVKALTRFRDSEWPPQCSPVNPPGWMNSSDESSKEEEGKDDDMSTTRRKSLENNSTWSSQRWETEMPPTVIYILETYSRVMTHPNKTSKMCEMALGSLTLLITHGYIRGKAGLRTASSSSASTNSIAADQTESEIIPTEEDMVLHNVMESVTKCSESSSETVQTAMTKTLLAFLTSSKCGIHEASMLTAVRATFHVYLVSKSSNAKEVSRSTLVDMLKSVFNRMVAYDAAKKDASNYISLKDLDRDKETDAPTEPPQAAPQRAAEFTSQLHTDGYLLFRALCKLSAKPLPGDDALQNSTSSSTFLAGFGAVVDPLALHSKILSLELILCVFENWGDAFRKSERFLYAVQNYLCVSLLKNCMSSHTQVAYLSLKIFLVLVYNLKSHLKSEIEVFVANIFLRVLESPNSSFDQKALVLEALRALCADPLMLTQIFLNYDCDYDAVNLYKAIIHNLTRLCGKPHKNSEERTLSLAGLEVLVVILRAFLKALGLPGEADEDLQGRTNNERFQLDVGLAVTVEAAKAILEDSAENMESVDYKESPDGFIEEKENVASQRVRAFEGKRTNQESFETGLVKFTLSMKSGLLYYIDKGFVKCDAKSVALFFHENADRLDKTQIGDALGREPEASLKKGVKDKELGGEGFWVRILYHYVDALDFTDVKFDHAIRMFLGGFRLPGEAQKIDRIMEKFAERFTRQNEAVFPSADTAFILAFSIIMLNTDLHSPNIKPEKRMTIESFVRNNRGISINGTDLPLETLTDIYNSIKEAPFSLKEDDDARATLAKEDNMDYMFFDAASFFGSNADDRRKEIFRKEREEMMAASEQLIKKCRTDKQQSKNNATTEGVSPADVVKPMFDVTWGPLIGTLSQVLEMTNDHNSIALCLNGFVYAVRLSSHSRMSLARDTFVNSLTKFTSLGSVKEMKYKNIESIRTLLSIAIIDGEFLAESWGPVLGCISQLARLQLSASGLARDDEFLEDNVSSTDTRSSFFSQRKDTIRSVRETEELNGRAVLAAVNEILIDKVYSSSVKLSTRGIAHFIEQLIAVSQSEIGGGQTDHMVRNPDVSQSGDRPRIFSLQRLVEVADYNMDVRPRIAWAQMWEMMANHFAKIGCNNNVKLSMFAIDALRQLSFKFLEKPELSDFNFQRLFLKPFLLIMENPGSRDDIRELVLRCVDNMIRLMCHNLRSGWKIFFSILTLSATDPCEKISTLGLAILQRLLDEHLDLLCCLGTGRLEVNEESTQDPSKGLSTLERRRRNANAEDFVGLCHASLSFVQTEELERPLPIGLSMRALCHTACYADLIAEKRVLPPVAQAQSTDPFSVGYTYEGLPEGEAEDMVLWRPLFDGLAAGMCSTARSNSGGVGCLVHRGSVMTMRAILLRHGRVFTVNQWEVLLKFVILPSIQRAAEYDTFPVVSILSESPVVSSFDFLSESLPLPPKIDDEGLVMFALQAQHDDSALPRPLGQAELLVEASFADLRHGGDGNLSRAYGLVKKDFTKINNHEQPFPDSWIATTAPIALGMITDVVSELIFDLGSKGREQIWPILLSHYHRWILGTPTSCDDKQGDDEVSVLDDMSFDHHFWKPCEALVRISCKELSRIPMYLSNASDHLDQQESVEWWRTISASLADTISQNAALGVQLRKDLVESKNIAMGLKTPNKESCTDDNMIGIETPFGQGKLIDCRRDIYSTDGDDINVRICSVKLEWGAILYGPLPEEMEYAEEEKIASLSHQESLQMSELDNPSDHGEKFLSRENYLDRFIPSIKVRCVAAHELQRELSQTMDTMTSALGEKDSSLILNALEESRQMGSQALVDQDLAHAFQESTLQDWGDGVEEVEAALATMGGSSHDRHRGGSEVFFLAQEAGADSAIIHLLSVLYCYENTESGQNKVQCMNPDWDCKSFAEPLLLKRIKDVLTNFLDSEKKDGHLIDPNVWQKPSVGGGGKIALYCTSYARVVVHILNVILMFSPEQFEKHTKDIYPLLCLLVRVHSDEIRGLVGEVLRVQVGRLLDL